MEKLPQFEKPEYKELEEIIERLRFFVSDEGMDLNLEKVDLEEIPNLLDSVVNIVKSETIMPEPEKVKEVEGLLYELEKKLSCSAESVDADWSILRPYKERTTKEDVLRMKLLGLCNRTSEITTMLWKMTGGDE